MPDPQKSDPSNQRGHALPLVIAVSGHRDILASEASEIRARVREMFEDFRQRWPDRRLSVMSPLAEGADRLVAEEALALGLDLVVPLPMPRELYLQDFESAGSRAEFEDLCERATDIFELPFAKENGAQDLAEPGLGRNLQYAQLGVFLCAHCHVLLALWDGKPSDDLGGTAQVVQFHHDDIMPGYTTTSAATQQNLVDDESDLVYHVVCSRDRPNGEPLDGLRPLDCWWFTKDRKIPRSRELPAQHRLIFKRSAEFSADAMRFSGSIAEQSYPLLDEQQKETLPPEIGDINRIFCVADFLAIHYQKRVLFSLRATHIFAFLMGFMFILYSDFRTSQYFMFAFLLFFLVAAVVQYLATRGAWHRKYLDYRALAEGLRVQFYWAVAGIRNESESKFTHDNFLQTQDPELGWIRNVMRVAGTRCDAVRTDDPKGLKFTVDEWIGSSTGGQLGYFLKRAGDGSRRSKLTKRIAFLSLLTSALVVTAITFFGSDMADNLRDYLMVAMGGMLLVIGVRHGYAYSTAENELIKQYEFMLRIFSNARRRLDDAQNDMERREILRALGASALDEHAEWILLHRDRSPDQGEIWLLGS